VAECAKSLRRLGDLSGALHVVLASDATAPDFRPEPLTREDREALADEIERRLDEIDRARVLQAAGWPGDARGAVDELVAQGRAAMGRVRDAVLGMPGDLAKIRVHGDYHLGQVLATADDFVVIDFEGEPLRPMAERRARSSPLRDVAGMLRSFAYAAYVAARETPGLASGVKVATWERAAREAFLDGYVDRARSAAVPLLPGDPDALARALALFELHKALYEVMYEAGHRPDWIAIPVEGARRALAAVTG
jgi:maltose alpha-D-glucosyltransferase/alpha-amylase